MSEPSWRLVGKLSVRTSDETRVLNVDWVQSGERGSIKVSGLLGLAATRITILGDRLMVEGKDGVIPWVNQGDYPWRSLVYWVRGLQGPGGAAITGSKPWQAGPWQVRLLEADSLGPRLMEFEHSQVKLRLRVKQWEFSGVTADDV